jgi:putative transposase
MARYSIQKRAESRRWGYREANTLAGGRPSKIYFTAGMDEAFRRRIAAAERRNADDAATPTATPLPATAPGDAATATDAAPPTDSAAPPAAPPATLPARITESGPPPGGLSVADGRRRALARLDLARAYAAAVDAVSWGERLSAREQFALAYNSGKSHPLIYSVLGPVSWQTLDHWLKAGDDALLAGDRRGSWKRGCRLLTHEQQEVLLRCALNPNKPRISEAIRLARAVMESRGIQNGHSERTYRRFLIDWRERNRHLWTFTREGKSAWNDDCCLSIERDYDAIDVGDVIVADGHTLNFEILSPWTGKPKRMTLILWYDMKSNFPLGWEIMPTENTAAIAAALRRAILRLGKIPRVAYLDNGKAFGARFFNGLDLSQAGVAGLFGRLGIQTIFAWPYHGQSKTVERFFGTFAELERLCPTYTGTSIADKPPRLDRGERVHRRLHERMTGGAGITMEQAHRAIAAWFDLYAARPQSGHLSGRTPLEVFTAGRGPGVDRQGLIYLMMADESRRIHRSGIHFMGRTYYDPALYGRSHAVTIRYDLQDPSAIYVFEQPSGEYLCEARPVDKIHPAATVLGTDEDRAKLSEYIKIKKGQEKLASAFAREFLADEVLPEHNRMLARLGIEQKDEVGRLKGEEPAALPMSAAETERIEAEVARLQKMQDELPPEDDPADEPAPEVVDDAAELRFRLGRLPEPERYEALMEMELQGHLMCQEYRAFMTYFELTEEYRRHRDYYEAKKLAIAAAMR